MQIAIIGKGQMGNWFANHFASHDVRLYGRNDSLSAASSSDAIIVAVSLSQMLKITKDLGRIVRPDQLVVEIASIKSHFIEAFEKLPCKKASIHPMFGPSAKSVSNQNVIVISDVGTEKDREDAESFFAGANISRMSAKEHDRAMAYALCLPYYLCLAFEDIAKDKFDAICGPSFRSQKEVAAAVLSGGDLVDEIIRLNPYSADVLMELENSLSKFAKKAFKEQRSA